jgi:atypical dual specificity phosphatase
MHLDFDWIVDKRVAGCEGARTESDLEYLKNKGVGALVRLAPEIPMTRTLVEAHGIEDCYEPIRNRAAASQEKIDRVLKFIHCALDQGKRVAVSCNAGHGRTGTILACYLVSRDYTVEQAKEQLLRCRPGCEEALRNSDQMNAINEFARRYHRSASDK